VKSIRYLPLFILSIAVSCKTASPSVGATPSAPSCPKEAKMAEEKELALWQTLENHHGHCRLDYVVPQNRKYKPENATAFCLSNGTPLQTCEPFKGKSQRKAAQGRIVKAFREALRTCQCEG
jgi:hypothetical protein